MYEQSSALSFTSLNAMIRNKSKSVKIILPPLKKFKNPENCCYYCSNQ